MTNYVLEGDHQPGSVYIVNAELLADIGKEINKQYIHEFESNQLESIKRAQLKALQERKSRLMQEKERGEEI